MAVGVIIGGAFQSIVTALTNSFINPLIALITGGTKVDENGNPIYIGGKFVLNGVSFDYGAFLSAVINFFIMAIILFLLIKAMNKIMEIGKKTEEVTAPTTKKCLYCQSEIDIKATRCPHCTSILEE